MITLDVVLQICDEATGQEALGALRDYFDKDVRTKLAAKVAKSAELSAKMTPQSMEQVTLVCRLQLLLPVQLFLAVVLQFAVTSSFLLCSSLQYYCSLHHNASEYQHNSFLVLDSL